MKITCKFTLALYLVAGSLVMNAAKSSSAQVRRYEPSRPTVSPYLNLFRDDDTNPFLPNYQTLVRPQLEQYRVNQQQQQQLRQQSQTIGQLQGNLQDFERRQAQGLLVAPTGKASWFNRPSTRSQFLDTSRFYSQSGTVRR